MNKKMTQNEIYEAIAKRVKNGGRLKPIADENGNLSDGLKVARLDCGDGQITLKIGTLDEICNDFGMDRPICDDVIEHLVRVKLDCDKAFTVKDKLEDSLTDENVLLL